MSGKEYLPVLCHLPNQDPKLTRLRRMQECFWFIDHNDELAS